MCLAYSIEYTIICVHTEERSSTEGSALDAGGAPFECQAVYCAILDNLGVLHLLLMRNTYDCIFNRV